MLCDLVIGNLGGLPFHLPVEVHQAHLCHYQDANKTYLTNIPSIKNVLSIVMLLCGAGIACPCMTYDLWLSALKSTDAEFNISKSPIRIRMGIRMEPSIQYKVPKEASACVEDV